MVARGLLARGTTTILAAIIGSVLVTASAVADNVPLPTPAPLPKDLSAPNNDSAPVPPAAIPDNSAPASTGASDNSVPPPPHTGFFPFSFGLGQATAFDAKQRALLDKISMYLSSVQTMVGNFVQVGPDGGRTEGTFYIQKPGRVRFEYNPPSTIDIVADGSSVVVRDRSLATQDLYPLSQTPLRYLLADHIDLLRDTDVVSVSSDDTYATVVLQEKQLIVGTSRLMMMFDAKTLQLKQWTVTDPQGLDTTVAVYNLDSTKKPDPNLFVINYQRNPGSSDQ